MNIVSYVIILYHAASLKFSFKIYYEIQTMHVSNYKMVYKLVFIWINYYIFN